MNYNPKMSVSRSRVTCCDCASKVLDLQQEVKLWKAKTAVEQKWRKILQRWILNAFGYDVKVEYERDTQMARVQAIENKLAMKTRSSDLLEIDDCNESEVKVVLMEIDLEEDYFEFDETCSFFSDVPLEQETTSVSIANQNHSQLGSAVPVEIGDGANAEVVYITGNYNEENGGGEVPSASYFILRSGDKEEIPVHVDYSHFLNGESLVQGDNNVFYRISEPLNNPNAPSPTSPQPQPQTIIYNPAMLVQSASPSIIKKRKPSPKNPNPSPKTKTPASSKKKPAAPKTQNSSDSPKKSKTPKRSTSPNQNQHKSNEFGLTLREKAEIFVSIKAREAIRRVHNGFECGICTSELYTYTSIETCMTHTKIHFEGKPYKCDCCEELFTVQRELLVHKREKHPRIKPATQTNPKLKVLASVATTNRQKTPPYRPGSLTQDKKWKCPISGCPWSYATEEELGWHAKAHAQARV